MISFASDNYAGALPEVMAAIVAANQGHMTAYGGDPITGQATALIQHSLNTDAPIYFVCTGTAANVLALKTMVLDYQSIIAPDCAHIVTLEVGAPAHLTGSKILLAESHQGKITAESIRQQYQQETFWGRHATEPKAVSISQPTELGTVYTLAELAEIRAVCDELKLTLHIDGCRIYNAAAALNCSLADLAQFADVLCLGGTKAGLMFGEALVFNNQALAHNFERRQKLGLQLLSKTRYVSAQFAALFTDDLGLKTAHHTNALAQRLWSGLQELRLTTSSPVETNQLFVALPEHVITPLQERYPFYVFNKESGLVRLIVSHDLTEEHVDDFLALLKNLY